MTPATSPAALTLQPFNTSTVTLRIPESVSWLLLHVGLVSYLNAKVEVVRYFRFMAGESNEISYVRDLWQRLRLAINKIIHHHDIMVGCF